MTDDRDPVCSFCGKASSEVNMLIQSTMMIDKFICDECVDNANELIGNEKNDLPKKEI
jgi:ATP-dependent protease Clp ATPase subunit